MGATAVCPYLLADMTEVHDGNSGPLAVSHATREDDSQKLEGASAGASRSDMQEVLPHTSSRPTPMDTLETSPPSDVIALAPSTDAIMNSERWLRSDMSFLPNLVERITRAVILEFPEAGHDEEPPHYTPEA